VDEAQSVQIPYSISNISLLTTLAVRLQSGSLAVFSPVALTDEVKRKVEEMGEVRYICAPDAEVPLSQKKHPSQPSHR
jgi:hypothetical protein